MSSKVFGFRSPEEEELHRKQVELGHLQAKLADAELELATLRAELIAFERQYMEAVGGRYAELDRLEALIAEAEARRRPTDQSAREKAQAARARAQQSAEALDDTHGKPCHFEPTEEIKGLYRRAAKDLHPDLTTDPEERERRKRAMVDLNRAYEERDDAAMRRILARWRSSPEQVRGNDTASQLVRVIREIAQVRSRLTAIKGEREELEQAEIARLKRQVQEAAAQGRDLLREIAQGVERRIEQARIRLRQAAQGGKTHER